MNRKRLIFAAGVLALLGGASGLFYAWHPAIVPIAPPSPSSFDPELVAKGQTLALLGDCRTCHTAPTGRVFAGGLAMPTPFGTIYSTNITPDSETGIGRWSEAAFSRAMRQGVDRQGRHLYPAFPYDHFSSTTDEDVKALYAFFMTRDPVKAIAPPNALPFPINVRLVLAGWKLLYLPDRRFQPDLSKDDTWNRGKYLAEGLGHCGDCHTPRNLMGAEQKSRAFQGGEAEGWRAYALGSASQSPVPWDEAALTQYLAEGYHPIHGVARGPMAPVVANLALVPRSDVAAIARYVASLSNGSAVTAKVDLTSRETSAGPGNAPQSAGLQAATPAASENLGSRIYAATCASCHESGRGLPLGGIKLAASTAVGGESAENLVNLILNGLPAVNDGSSQPIMPGFANVLTDAQLEDLLKHVRTTFGQKPMWTNAQEAIHAGRKALRPAINAKRSNEAPQ